MAKTPDVVVDELIDVTWGNQIRDRTTQVFASVADMQTWAAPPGSFAFVTASNVLYVRRDVSGAPTWFVYQVSAAFDLTTDGNGEGLITHGLGVTPRWVQLTPNNLQNATFSQCSMVSWNSTVFRIRCRNYDGVAYSSGTRVTGFWQAGG